VEIVGEFQPDDISPAYAAAITHDAQASYVAALGNKSHAKRHGGFGKVESHSVFRNIQNLSAAGLHPAHHVDPGDLYGCLHGVAAMAAEVFVFQSFGLERVRHIMFT